MRNIGAIIVFSGFVATIPTRPDPRAAGGELHAEQWPRHRYRDRAPDHGLNCVQRTNRLRQSIWIDSISRADLRSGKLARQIEAGVTGLTSNPSIFKAAIRGSDHYDDALRRARADGKSPLASYEGIAIRDIRDAADLLRPVYEATGHRDGYASLEVNPALAHDTPGTVREARALWHTLDRPNVMIKVPATEAGIPAIHQLTAAGINVNATLIFSREGQYRSVANAYIDGLEQFAEGGGDLSQIASVASFFVSRIDTAVDTLLEKARKELEEAREEEEPPSPLLGKAAIANARLAYAHDFLPLFSSRRFRDLQLRGARPQRVLWASTSTKNKSYPDTLYVDALIARHTVNTLPETTLDAFLDHGQVDGLALTRGVAEARETLEQLQRAGINLTAITDQLLRDGLEAFQNDFTDLLAHVESKQQELRAPTHEAVHEVEPYGTDRLGLTP